MNDKKKCTYSEKGNKSFVTNIENDVGKSCNFRYEK